MKKKQRCIYYLVVLLLTTALPGCLITTQSFNHGKLLNPGERIVTQGFGWRYSARSRPVSEEYDSAGYYLYRTRKDSTRLGWWTYTFDYRVGVLRTYPFGRGLETGFHLEMAFRGNQVQTINGKYEYPVDSSNTWQRIYVPPKFIPTDTQYNTEPETYGPPVLEIDTRFGLPDMVVRKGILHHNVNIGWVVGYWVDNGWFLGYAAGWEFPRVIPYYSARLFLTATDAMNGSIGDSDFFTKHDRHWGGRITGGASLRLPFNFSILPEFISPECSVTFPNYSTGQPVGVNAALGIRWMLGQ